MKKYYVAMPLVITTLLVTVLPQIASAHAHYTFQIGNKTYQLVVGSLNEPLIVDDKSGLDLTVTQGGGMPTMGPDGDMDGPPVAGMAVSGLEKTLKVEMDAGSQKKTMDLRPAYGKPGGYTTVFYPTVQTTFSYRLFGTIDNVPVDISFTCNPAGHSQTADDKSMVKLSNTVTQTAKSGAFGCAEAKSDYGFPAQSASLYDLNGATYRIQNAVDQAQSSANSSRSTGVIGIVIGFLGLLVGAGAWVKGRKIS